MGTEHSEEFDVVIAGFGGAGAAAAISASNLGGRVLILEKQTKDAHIPSTAVLSGGVMIVDDVGRATRYIDSCAMGMSPLAVSQAWAVKASDLAAWVSALDPDHFVLGPSSAAAEHPQIEGSESILRRGGQSIGSDGLLMPARGRELFNALRYAVDARNVEYRFGKKAVRLLRTPAGKVDGLVYEHPNGSTSEVRARRGVVLATGGFGFNDELKRQYLSYYPSYFYGGPASTGDGIALAQDVGAALWHMNLVMGRGVGHFRSGGGDDLNVILQLDPRDAPSRSGYVIADRHGARFANENLQASLGHSFDKYFGPFDAERREYPRIPSYWFFDDRRRKVGPLTVPGYGFAGRQYTWSADNRAEIEKGWIIEGATIGAAAAAAGITDPGRAEASVHDYNEGCITGNDAFGRIKESLIPLDEPPFYCVPIWPGGTSTVGGPRRDEYGRVLHALGGVIPGLYGAGELGSNMGMLYPGGSAYNSDVLCSGRIAGESAMTLTS